MLHIEYISETELKTEFQKHMKDSTNVEAAVNYLYETILDETILGIVFELHHAIKTGSTSALEGQAEDNKPFSIADIPLDLDVFASNAGNAKKAIDCTCPNCDRAVAASRFAPHLEKCMGMGRNSSRIASRRIANSNSREGSNNYFSTAALSDDDEDDIYWSGEKRKKKIQTIRTNGTKKNGKSS